MEMVKLVRPSEDYADAIWDFRQEILAADDVSKFAGCSALLDSTDAHGWIQKVTVLSDPATCPDDLIPSDSYLAIRPSDDRLVGTIDLRHSIDHPVLGTWGGNIGTRSVPANAAKGMPPRCWPRFWTGPANWDWTRYSSPVIGGIWPRREPSNG